MDKVWLHTPPQSCTPPIMHNPPTPSGARKAWAAMHHAAVEMEEWGQGRMLGAFADVGDVDMIKVVYDNMRAAGIQPTMCVVVVVVVSFWGDCVCGCV